ncbi:Crotonobetainyl-CoA:carnitine CoA-transferase CaiB [Rhizobiales bacterium GAS113]|nr:Crotonobetainyl-CoA:carnitine CoA-transferase CaiB [Rhizobiales bacterium GAS113]SEB80204.1 Crotonobetainyl-CoA:carnitine CoA-transferase CaiB [Rhizobiales bacterium GAS188]
MTGPLSGIRVVEFSHMVMGPSCGLVLGDLGADVVKIEPAPDGDNTRRLVGAGAGFFATFNRNKRSLALNLKAPKGLALAKKLIARADVMTENFRPGGLEALGLGYEALTLENPGLIYCSLKGFLAGPYENRAALDEVVQMMGGLAYMTGPPGRPLRAGTSVNDIMGGMFAAIGILAALHERARTGKGQVVRSALFENNAFLVAQHMAQYAVTGQPAAPMPARISAWGIYDVFDTRDGEQVFVGVVTDTQWAVFCREFDQPQLFADATLATNSQRVGARDRLLPVLRQLFARFTRAEIIATFERARLPFAPIMKPEDLFDDPHLTTPGAMVEVSKADGGTMPIPALPLEMAGRRFGRRLDVPRLGEHSAQIAAELGYEPQMIEELAAEGVLTLGDPAPSAAAPKLAEG